MTKILYLVKLTIMTANKLLEKTNVQKIGKNPVVVLPLRVWREVESRLEDLAIAESKHLKLRITKARKEKRLYSSTEAKKLLRV